MDEGSGFENRRSRKGTRGSNPFSSAENLIRVSGLCAGVPSGRAEPCGPFGLLEYGPRDVPWYETRRPDATQSARVRARGKHRSKP